MKHLLLPMNLQFFAEAGETGPEVAAPAGEETVETGAETSETGAEEQEVAEPADTREVQSPEDNARFAAARRAAEEEQKKTDSRFAKLFGNHTNPATGKPILTARDYLDAMEAQEQMQRMAKLQESGVDPKLLNAAIMNSPIMQQAQQYMAMQNEQNAAAQLERDLKAISAIDPSIKTLADLAAQENYSEILNLVQVHNLNVEQAYKLVNMDKITQKRTDAAQQAAINQAKNKQHLNPTTGVTAADGLKEIPASELSRWKQFFPNASMKELREKYNRVNR